MCFFATAFFACSEITFKEPQPRDVKNLHTFPKALQGKYIIPKDSGSTTFDTVYIDLSGYRINTPKKPGDWIDSGVLSDSLVLKQYKGFYFLNFYSDEQWIMRTFRQDKTGNVFIYEMNISDNAKMEALKEKFNPEVIKKNSSTYYRIDPSPKSLLEFIQQHYTTQEPMRKIQ
jgi:hypothetical protein